MLVTAINFDLATGREYPYVAVGAFLFAISGKHERSTDPRGRVTTLLTVVLLICRLGPSLGYVL